MGKTMNPVERYADACMKALTLYGKSVLFDADVIGDCNNRLYRIAVMYDNGLLGYRDAIKFIAEEMTEMMTYVDEYNK